MTKPDFLAMEQNFKVGDIVRLKEGSPDLTIKTLLPLDARRKSMALCSWEIMASPGEDIIPLGQLVLVSSTGSQEVEVNPFLEGPMPSEAIRLMLMRVALKHSSSHDDFVEKYLDLLFRAQYSMKQGSLAWVCDQGIPQMADHPQKESTQTNFHQFEAGAAQNHH